MLNYTVLQKDVNGSQLIELTSGKYSGIIYSYGKVEFGEEEDHAVMHFEYTVHDDFGIELNEEELKQELGDILLEIIETGIAKNSIVYSGGVDENRTEDS
jgi:hypothetical protein